MMSFRLQILLATLLLFACTPAFAGKRVALVLGNSAYQNVPRLTNPANDAALMAETFKKAGFDVVVSKQDLGALETRRVLRDFSDSAADAEIAVIYYAGHGIEIDGTNYLIPVDAKLERDNDVYDEAFSLERRARCSRWETATPRRAMERSTRRRSRRRYAGGSSSPFARI